MANDLGTLTDRLAQQLHIINQNGDIDNSTWYEDELDDLITDAVESLWPRHRRAHDPYSSTEGQVTLVEDQYVYSLPTGMREVSRIDIVALDADANATEAGRWPGNAWEMTGDSYSSPKLRLNPQINNTHAGNDSYLRLTGYGAYDTADNLIPDRFVPLVLARARAEAYRRLAGNRSKFENWLASNQTQNVSVNELLQLVREAETEAQDLTRRTPRVWAKPVAGRVG
jgi:hypothetical protein